MAYFLMVSLSCGALILLVTFLSRILGNRLERKWRYIVWLVIALRMLIPVDISLPQPVVYLEMPVPEAGEAYTKVLEAENSSTVNPVGNMLSGTERPESEAVVSKYPEPIKPSFDWGQLWRLTPWIWLGGALIYGAWLIIGYYAQRRELLRWSYQPQGDTLKNSVNYYAEELRIKRDIPIRVCKRITSPMLLGLIKPVLLMPEGSYTPKELEYILKHELSHIKRKDIWVKAFVAVVRAIHWFNPAGIILSRGVSEDIEILCDARVVKDLDAAERKEYNEILLSHMTRKGEERVPLTTCFGSGLRRMKERLVQVSRKGNLRKGYVLCAILLVMVIGGSLLASCGEKEESSKVVKEDSRPEESSKIEESSRPEESSKIEESSRPEESSKIEESSRLEESSKIEESSKVEESFEVGEAGWWLKEREWKDRLDKDQAAAYTEVVEELLEEYGPIRRIDTEGDHGVGWVGLVIVECIDFDRDGILELYCGYAFEEERQIRQAYQAIYKYENGEAVCILDDTVGATKYGTIHAGVSGNEQGDVYLEREEGEYTRYLILENGEFRTADVTGHTISGGYFDVPYNYLVDVQDDQRFFKTKESIRQLYALAELPEPDLGTATKEERAAQYLEIIEELEEEYGKGRWEEGSLLGVNLIYLVDLGGDSDGEKELYCVCGAEDGSYVEYIYSHVFGNFLLRDSGPIQSFPDGSMPLKCVKLNGEYKIASPDVKMNDDDEWQCSCYVVIKDTEWGYANWHWDGSIPPDDSTLQSMGIDILWSVDYNETEEAAEELFAITQETMEELRRLSGE